MSYNVYQNSQGVINQHSGVSRSSAALRGQPHLTPSFSKSPPPSPPLPLPPPLLNFEFAPNLLAKNVGRHNGSTGPASNRFKDNKATGTGGVSTVIKTTSNRLDEDARRKRLHAIMNTLSAVPGRLCEESIERSAYNNGLSVLWDPPFNEPIRKDAVRTLTMAGAAFILDIEFLHHFPHKLTLSIPDSTETSCLQAEPVTRILQSSLTPPPRSAAYNVSLETFSANLSLLSRLDKLSTASSFNCYAALVGLYTSLRRLYTDQLTRCQSSNSFAVIETLRRRCGRPRLNPSRRFGLFLDYWTEQAYPVTHTTINDKSKFKSFHSHTSPSSVRANDFMEIDTDDNTTSLDDLDFDSTYSLSIECETSVLRDFPDMIITEQWISTNIYTKLNVNDSFDPSVIDWLDLESSMKQNSYSTIQNVHFVAKLNPPIPVPWKLVVQIYQSQNLPIPDKLYPNERLDELLYASPEHRLRRRSSGSASTSSSNTTSSVTLDLTTKRYFTEQLVLPAPPFDTPETDYELQHRHVRVHQINLSVPRIEAGVLLLSFPFVHPRCVYQWLPVLRQYAFLDSMFANYLRPPHPSSIDPCTSALLSISPATSNSSSTNVANNSPAYNTRRSALPHQSSFGSLLTSSSTSSMIPLVLLSSNSFTPAKSPQTLPTGSQLRVHAILHAQHENPFLSFTFSSLPSSVYYQADFNLPNLLGYASTTVGVSDVPCSCELEIGPNAELSIIDHNIKMIHCNSNLDFASSCRRLASSLELIGHPGVWIEWIRNCVNPTFISSSDPEVL